MERIRERFRRHHQFKICTLKQKKGSSSLTAQGTQGSGGDLLSRTRKPGTIGDKWLDCRVRNGNGYDPLSMTTEISISQYRNQSQKKLNSFYKAQVECYRHLAAHAEQSHIVGKKDKPHGLLVSLGSTYRYAYTCDLSTLSSLTTLQGVTPARPYLGNGFTLRCFQRFSDPHMATRRCRWRDSRYTRGASVPVLSY